MKYFHLGMNFGNFFDCLGMMSCKSSHNAGLQNEATQADVLFKFDILIFQRAPETLHLCIIQTAPTSVHADLNTMVLEFHHKLRTGKLASQIQIGTPGSQRNPQPFSMFQNNEKRPAYFLRCKQEPCG